MPEPGKLLGKINWRINKGDEDFIERSTTQKFVQARPFVKSGCWVRLCMHFFICFLGSSVGHSGLVHPDMLVLPVP